MCNIYSSTRPPVELKENWSDSVLPLLVDSSIETECRRRWRTSLQTPVQQQQQAGVGLTRHVVVQHQRSQRAQSGQRLELQLLLLAGGPTTSAAPGLGRSGLDQEHQAEHDAALLKQLFSTNTNKPFSFAVKVCFHCMEKSILLNISLCASQETESHTGLMSMSV